LWTVAFAQLFNATATNSAGGAQPTVQANNAAITPVIHKGLVCNNGKGRHEHPADDQGGRTRAGHASAVGSAVARSVLTASADSWTPCLRRARRRLGPELPADIELLAGKGPGDHADVQLIDLEGLHAHHRRHVKQQRALAGMLAESGSAEARDYQDQERERDLGSLEGPSGGPMWRH